MKHRRNNVLMPPMSRACWPRAIYRPALRLGKRPPPRYVCSYVCSCLCSSAAAPAHALYLAARQYTATSVAHIRAWAVIR